MWCLFSSLDPSSGEAAGCEMALPLQWLPTEQTDLHKYKRT